VTELMMKLRIDNDIVVRTGRTVKSVRVCV